MNKQDILDAVKSYAENHLNKAIFVPGVSPVPVSGAVLYPEDIEEVADTLLEFWYTDWKKCAEFKRRLCNITGKRNCVLVNSGSSASLVAQTILLRQSKLKYVVTTALGFPTTVYPIWQNGKVPIFIDIDLKTLSPERDNLRGYWDNPNISGYIFAHTLGFPFDETYFVDNGWFLSDCCDALGAELHYEEGPYSVGAFADAMILSFFPAHQITSAEGGAILTDSKSFADKMESLVNWGRACDCLPGQSNVCGHRFDIENLGIHGMPEGWDHKYTFSSLGYNLKMTEFQAALGMSQLTHLDDFVNIRRDNFTYLQIGLSKHSEYLDFIEVPEWSRPSPFGFPIFVKKDAPFKTTELIQYLEDNKIRTRRIFGGNLTRQPFIKDLNYLSLNLANTDYVMEYGFWIGCHPQITEAHMDYVFEIFDNFFKEKGLSN